MLTFVGLALVYLGISWFVADRLTRRERHRPAAPQIPYEVVEFEIAVHGLTLRGWWMQSTNSDRAVLLVHGRNSN